MTLSPSRIHLFILFSGIAALSWEVIWQVKAGLALGVSAWGAALTLAVTMGGMAIGALLMGHFLRKTQSARPLRLYAVIEVFIGLCGLFLGWQFQTIENIDTFIYATQPDRAVVVFLLSITLVLAPPAIGMGATLPIFGLIARQLKTSLALLYGLNTLGAALGALLAAFLFIPMLGIGNTACFIAAINIIVGASAWITDQGAIHTAPLKTAPKPVDPHRYSMLACAMIVAVTGFTTFVLEVAWFRALTSAFRSTTDAFAIMLSCALIALGVGASLVPMLKKRSWNLGVLLAWAGILIFAATPLIERFDTVAAVLRYEAGFPALRLLQWFVLTLYVIGPPMLLLGTGLPWVLEAQDTPRKWGAFYSLNAFCAILGALGAGWLLLPTFGFAQTAWIAAGLILATGIWVAPPRPRRRLAACGLAALLLAITFESGVGTIRVLGSKIAGREGPVHIVETHEGPDATISVIEYTSSLRSLVINGFTATTEEADKTGTTHYMPWMGHLPMLLSDASNRALVICFGTGQTAHAVRQEGVKALDIVDINEQVFKMGHHFTSNEDVLKDKRVSAIHMDGRAYIRRTQKIYDVITLEPMPPHFAGVNALYSLEFYQQAREKLSENGVIAQWLPFHLVGADYALAIAKTFQNVFPNAALWIDPKSTTGILIGSKNDQAIPDKNWPGFARHKIARTLTEKEVLAAMALDATALKAYASPGKIITDDNQLLSYGQGVRQVQRFRVLNAENMRQLAKFYPEIHALTREVVRMNQEKGKQETP